MKWANHSAFADHVINDWANKPIPPIRDLEGKGNGPRILLARLLQNLEIDEVNRTIMKLNPWGTPGSSWIFNKKGDYDFALSIFTTMLWKFGDKSTILFPGTTEHLLRVLLTVDGNQFRYSAPRSLGLVPETENHLLMTEGSRYLKNRWIAVHGNGEVYFDNVRNGMEQKILALLEEIRTAGLYEFNSNPYIGYTITALLNLEAFASEEVKGKARDVLDYMNYCYALGSYGLKHYPPFRRRYEKESSRELTTDYQSVFMKTWLSFSPVTDYNTDIGNGAAHALLGACMPYRPADEVVEMIFNKGIGYFVKLGHGEGACPEIYSAGKSFLLSAGGVNRGERSLIVARSVTLFLNDDAEKLSETFHLAGPGEDFMKWNNTGVYKNFACAAGPVFVPANIRPLAKNNNWSVYSMKDSLCIAVYSTSQFGLMIIFEHADANGLLTALIKANPYSERLKQHFRFPGGENIQYDVNAPANRWVIISDNDQLMNREFDQWPLIAGTVD